MATQFLLAEALERAGMTQRELAQRSGVSPTTINRMCANLTRGVSLNTLDRLADALGIPPSDLIGPRNVARRKSSVR